MKRLIHFAKPQELVFSIKFLCIITCAILLLFPSCTKEKQESKNIEQIYKEEGIPVRTEIVTAKEFKALLSYNAELKGIKESTVKAPIGDEVEKIFVKIGDFVKKDQVLLSFPTDNPQAMYFQAKVAFENAEAAFQRIENLYKSGGISLQDKDNAKAAYEVAKANWNSAKQSVKVKAPISGYVTKIGVSETDSVNRDTELFTIADTKRLKAFIWISEGNIFDVEKGMTAVAAWQGFTIEGQVVQVDMAMNQKMKAFRALVEFDNPDNLLKAGTTVEISIATTQKAAAIVVKRWHLVKENNNTFVYIVKNGSAEKRPVKIGKTQDMDIEVLEGIQPGEELVVEGQLLLEPGSKVKVIK